MAEQDIAYNMEGIGSKLPDHSIYGQSPGSPGEKNQVCCTLCPRECRADRAAGRVGRCGVSEKLKIARAALHYWEEPCISGTRGSGAVFFSGCSLGCIYCQNRKISGGRVGQEISWGRLAEIFLELQEGGANNINLVTAGHYVPQVCCALDRARSQGLSIPIVYNSSGYEKVEALRQLEGLVDIYLPDLKYLDPELARQYSHAPDYPEAAVRALEEMVRQQPKPEFLAESRWPKGGFTEEGQRTVPAILAESRCPEHESAEENQQLTAVECQTLEASVPDRGTETGLPEPEAALLMRRGVIVRHLLLPGHVREAKRVVEYLYRTYGDRIYISMMNQYTPMREDFEDARLNRRVTRREYQRLLDYAMDLGVTQGFCQEGDTASESFIPEFH